MKYWWVNQDKTYRQEVTGGYMWSPQYSKSEKSGKRIYHQPYENMRHVGPGDLVFSYADERIFAIGHALGTAWEAPQPDEFANVPQNWTDRGWRVDVDFTTVVEVVRTTDFVDEVREFLPNRISPINRTDKVQSWYLFEVSESFAKALISHLATRGLSIPTAPTSYPEPGRNDTLGDREQERIEKDADTPETEKEALIKARIGQGQFRKSVFEVENRCRVTGVTHRSYLRASHIWPWRYCSDGEHLDGNNGLILAPNIDWVFDQGYISFQRDGSVVISAAADLESLEAFGIHADLNVGSFSAEQEAYLRKHRTGDKALGHPSVLRRKDGRGS